MTTEPILAVNTNRFVLFPIKHKDIWDLYKQAVASFWVAEEINLSDDLEHWKKLNSEEQHFIKHVLAFFAGADLVVNENIMTNFFNEVQIPEARFFYSFQMAIENIHSEVYSQLIDTYVSDNEEKERLFRAMQSIPAIQRKAEWIFNYFDRETLSYAERLVAFACMEGIFFSGSFCAIFWLKKRGLMPGLTFSNELISRDEGLHCKFAALMYSRLLNKPDRESILRIVTAAVDIESEFVSDALPVDLLGMNSKSMCQYVQFVADYLLGMLGYEPHYGVSNPFDWMELISLHGATNFFEKRVADYQKPGVGDANFNSKISFDDEF